MEYFIRWSAFALIFVAGWIVLPRSTVPCTICPIIIPVTLVRIQTALRWISKQWDTNELSYDREILATRFRYAKIFPSFTNSRWEKIEFHRCLTVRVSWLNSYSMEYPMKYSTARRNVHTRMKILVANGLDIASYSTDII